MPYVGPQRYKDMGAGKSHFQQNESYYRGRNNKLLPDFAKYKEAPLIKNRPRIFKNEGLSYKKMEQHLQHQLVLLNYPKSMF